jgi:hypothetical protein
MDKLEELGWKNTRYNVEDFQFEFRHGDRYIEIDGNYVDIYIYANGEYTRGWLEFSEIDALDHFIKNVRCLKEEE